MSLAYQINNVMRRPEVTFGRRGGLPSPGRMSAPVMGWNARDPYQNMKDGYAIKLENWFAELGFVRLRRGYTSHATGVGTGDVETLLSHVSGTTRMLVACGGGGIWNATNNAAATEISTSTPFTNNRWQHTAFNGRTFMVNGTDAPVRIEADGTLETSHGWTGTGLTPTNLIQVMPYARRLIFLEKDSAKLWIGPLESIQGELTQFNLAYVDPGGGNCVAIGTMTVDAGEGVDDLFVAIMETGTILVYSGTNPLDVNAFGLVGRFKVGRPIGNRPLVDRGGDLIAITTDGYIPLLQYIKSGRGRENKQVALSDTIAAAVSESARLYGDNFGWQAVLHTDANWLLFNVPAGSATQQHVMNTQTGAWCEFTGWPAICWAVHGGKIYFGASGGVVNEADSGATDGGNPIVADGQTAYNYFRTPMDKQFDSIRALLDSTSAITVGIGASVDFQPNPPSLDTNDLSIESEGSTWANLTWANFRWNSGRIQQAEWQDLDVSGTAVSACVRVQSSGARVSWYGCDLMYTPTDDMAGS